MNASPALTLNANPAGRAGRWLLLGLMLPLVLRAASLAFPALHDDVILPVLMLFVRPWLWVVWLAGLGMIAFRSEGGWGGLTWGSFALGIVMGLMLFYRWWYFDPLWFYLPWCFCLTVVAIVWRLRLLAWADGARSASLVFATVAVVLAGTSFDLSRGLPRWDSRFSPGLPGVINLLFTFVVLAAVGAVLFLWGRRHAAEVSDRNRRLLTHIIEQDPRCGAYFDAVTRVTPHGINRAALSRQAFSNVVDQARNRMPVPIFRPEDRLRHGGSRYVSDIYWRLKEGKAAAWLRFLREHRDGHALPSPYLLALLGEAVKREHVRWLESLGPETGGDGKTWLDLLPFCLGNPERIELANAHFARYVSLREAQIEAEHVFFMAAPGFNARLVDEWLKEFNGQMKLLRHAAPARESPNAPDTARLPAVAEAYLQLWAEQMDRLFIMYGDQMGRGMDGDRVNFRNLTGNVLASRGTPARFHEFAAALALSLFVVEDRNLAEKIAASLQNYYAVNERARPGWWGRDFLEAEGSEIAIAVSAYMLWLGIHKGWNDEAADPTTLPEFPSRHWLSARVNAHICAASFMASMRGRLWGMAAETNLNRCRDSYMDLPSASSNTFSGLVSGDLLAASFLTNLELSEKPAVQTAQDGGQHA